MLDQMEDEEQYEPPNPKRRVPYRNFNLVLRQCKRIYLNRIHSYLIGGVSENGKTNLSPTRESRSSSYSRFNPVKAKLSTEKLVCVAPVKPRKRLRMSQEQPKRPGIESMVVSGSQNSESSFLPGFLNEELVEFNSVRFRANKFLSLNMNNSRIMEEFELPPSSSEPEDESDSSDDDDGRLNSQGLSQKSSSSGASNDFDNPLKDDDSSASSDSDN